MITTDPIAAVDLRDLSEKEHEALRQEAIRRGMPLSEYLGKVVSEASRRIVRRHKKNQAKQPA